MKKNIAIIVINEILHGSLIREILVRIMNSSEIFGLDYVDYPSVMQNIHKVWKLSIILRFNHFWM